ncbi:hypothetical protein ACVR05_08065 [Streptococcus caprae]|uniref:Uncharacterized protein n=1 Tax=Streptococcus caprae TaxID=1640501 RepID=A0ABV8CU58_9STRE
MKVNSDKINVEIIRKEYHIYDLNQYIGLEEIPGSPYIGTVSHIYENSGAGEQIYVLTNQTGDTTIKESDVLADPVPYTASESESSPLKCQILQVMLYYKYIRRLVSL